MVPHPDYPRILKLLAGCPTIAFDRIVYRSVASVYAGDKDLLSGLGSLKTGGRWNIRGIFRVVYASFDDHTALAESNAKFLSFGFSKPERRTIVPLRVRLDRVVDIHVFAPMLGVAVQDLITLDWKITQDAGNEPLTQAIGRAAYDLKIQAIQTPSDRYPAGMNLILLCDHMQIPTHLEILDPAGPIP